MVSSEIRVQTVNHLGIIAGLIDEIGVVEQIDQLLGRHPNKRADLKQFIIDLICSGDGDVPLYLRVADGNEADKAVFAKLMQEFRQQFCLDVLMVADSALYSAPNLKLLQGLRWISRVPLTVAEAKCLVDQLDEQEFVATSLPGYRIVEHNRLYGGVTQKWVIVESEARRQADIKQFYCSLDKLEQQLNHQLTQLSVQDFRCEADALLAADRFAKKLKYHYLQAVNLTKHSQHKKPGRPRKDAQPQVNYRIEATLSRNSPAIQKALASSGRFVLIYFRWLELSRLLISHLNELEYCAF